MTKQQEYWWTRTSSNSWAYRVGGVVWTVQPVPEHLSRRPTASFSIHRRRDGAPNAYECISDSGRPLRFRSIEAAKVRAEKLAKAKS